jgi:competence protein ComEC
VRLLASRPAVLLLGAWIGGVLAGDHTPLPAAAWAGIAALLLLIALGRGAARAPLPVVLSAGLLALAAAGAARVQAVGAPPAGDISRWIGRQSLVLGTVISEPAGNDRGQRFLLAVERVQVAGVPRPATGRLQVFAPVDRLAMGERVEVSGVPECPLPATNPGGFSVAAWLRRQGCFATLRSPILLHRGRGDLPWWRDLPARWRRALAAANRAAMEPLLARRGVPPEARADLLALVQAVTFGQPDTPEAEWEALEERFRDAGILHVLRVSGAQVGVLLWLLFLLRRRLALRLVAALSFPLIWLYAMMAGMDPSILRAAIMGSCYLVGRMVTRENVTENSLAVAGFAILTFQPLALYDVGFQFSFLAIWGLLRLAAPIEMALRPLLPGWGGADEPPHPVVRSLREWQCDPITWLAAAVGAPLFVVGVNAQSFQQFHLAGFVASLPAVPVAAATLLLALPLTLANAAWQAVGLPLPPPAPLEWGNLLLLGTARCLERVATYFAGLSGATLDVFPPGWPAVLLSLAAFLLAGRWLARSVEAGEGRRAALRAGAAAAVGLAVLAAGMFLPGRPPRSVEITVLDVGQGDCCLVRFPNGGTLLVDGGGSPFSDFDVGERIVAPALRALRIQRIDLLVLSHGHEDHVGGLPAVLRGFSVGRVVEAGGPVDAASYAAFRALIRARRIPHTLARRGTRLLLGAPPPGRPAAAGLPGATGPGDVLIETLHPPVALLAGGQSPVNDNSLVLRVTAGGLRILLTGDAEASAEAAMRGLDLRADLLKVGHHGSKSSTGDVWLAAVRPRLALVSCGRHNRFGHPHPRTLATLRRQGVPLFRTDRDGAVVVTAEGGRLRARGTLPAGR